MSRAERGSLRSSPKGTSGGESQRGRGWRLRRGFLSGVARPSGLLGGASCAVELFFSSESRMWCGLPACLLRTRGTVRDVGGKFISTGCRDQQARRPALPGAHARHAVCAPATVGRLCQTAWRFAETPYRGRYRCATTRSLATSQRRLCLRVARPSGLLGGASCAVELPQLGIRCGAGFQPASFGLAASCATSEGSSSRQDVEISRLGGPRYPEFTLASWGDAPPDRIHNS